MFNANLRRMLIILGLILIHATILKAEPARNLEIQVVGQTEEDIKAIPGAAAIIDAVTLEKKQPSTVNEMLQSVSGITVREEDGLGLRQNISIRGVPGDRSRKILVLEDGVPVSLAPYGENAMYYSPEVDRIDRIEIRKGSGSIAYGPQTIGGVIQYITPKAPETPESKLKVVAGSNNFKSLKYSFGGTYNDTGIYTSLLHKQGDGPRDPMPFTLLDFTGKINTVLSPVSELMLKAHYYNEDAKVSYTGLSEAAYERNHKINPALNDSLYVERAGVSVTHGYYGWNSTELKTTFYAHAIRRDWWRQDKNGLDSDGNQLFKNTNGGRNRTYKVVGLEPRLNIGNLESGLKVHYEEERNQRINGNSPTARTPRKGIGTSDGVNTDEIRDTFALSAFGLYAFEPAEKWTITPGVRVETFQQTRHILMNGTIFSTTDGVDTTVPVKTKTGIQTVFIPGLGFTYDMTPNVNFFGGVHRGFAPPSFSDAIDNSGEDQKLDAEESWNYEIGVRTTPWSWVNASATAFYYDYKNQIISGKASSGLTKFNSGESHSMGLELEMTTEHPIGETLSLEIRGAATYVESVFDGNITDADGAIKQTDGNRIPYVPKGTLSAGVGLSGQNKWHARIDGLYITAQASDAENTTAISADGTTGFLPAYSVFNFSTYYKLTPKWTILGAVKNILDEKYISSRAPEGIMPGVERSFTLGVETRF